MKAKVGHNAVMVVPLNNPDEAAALRDNKPVPKSIIPEKYTTSEAGLKFDVGAGDNTADFDLK